MVTITRHVFIDFFQTKHFSAVKFYMGYEKNMSFHVIPKYPKVWKKVEKIRLGSSKAFLFVLYTVKVIIFVCVIFRASAILYIFACFQIHLFFPAILISTFTVHEFHNFKDFSW